MVLHIFSYFFVCKKTKKNNYTFFVFAIVKMTTVNIQDYSFYKHQI